MKIPLYTQIHKSLGNIATVWPEKAFSYAMWSDIAKNIRALYGKHHVESNVLPLEVCAGHTHVMTPMGALDLPHSISWMAFKGLNIIDHNKEDSVYACRIMTSIVLRIVLSVQPTTLQVHQVDPVRMGAEMKALPLQPGVPRLNEDGLLRLLRQLDAEMAEYHAAMWRCDSIASQVSADNRPIHIILIANWDDLSKRRTDGETEESDSQKMIRRMLETDVAARNGIYFFICSDEEVAEGKLPVITAHDESHITLHSAEAVKGGGERIERKQELIVNLPTDEELEIIHAGYRSYLSGTLEDADGKGIWLGNSAKGLRAVMGTTPQGENQYFELGIGKADNAFHALIGGATGSGKSVLLNEIICSLAERYSPQELRMILLDYKEGTEFAPYTSLPHVFALSIGSNPEFGVETLKWLQEETERRGHLFKRAGVSNISDYRRVTGEFLCRYVVVADEFQVLCTDKKHGDEARALLNDLARRTRSFGINFILATQTLRDGALEGEAKNQFACRICLQLAENETDYFLATDNDAPAHFNRKGQALLNYSMGMKAGNILFQSGNRHAANGMFRTTAEVKKCLAELTEKAQSEGKMPEQRYIYESDGYANLTADMLHSEDDVLVGLRNNMSAAPFYLNKRHVGGGVLIVGQAEQKNAILLGLISEQSTSLYGIRCPIQTPSSYLDGEENYPLTIFSAAEGDVDLTDAVAEWKEVQQAQSEQLVTPLPSVAPMMDTGAFQAPAGMEGEFADLMKSMQNNFAAMQEQPVPTQTSGSRSGRRRRSQEKPLVVSVHSASDIRALEAGGLYTNDFRVVIYLDMHSYNQLSGNYESGTLSEAQILVENPRGTVTKVRIGRM